MLYFSVIFFRKIIKSKYLQSIIMILLQCLWILFSVKGLYYNVWLSFKSLAFIEQVVTTRVLLPLTRFGRYWKVQNLILTAAKGIWYQDFFQQWTDLCKLESVSNVANKYGLIHNLIHAKEGKAIRLLSM